MSWWAVLALCGGAYAFKLLGVALSGRIDAETADRWSLELIVVPVLTALILVQTLTTGRAFVLDARALAVAAAGLLVWRRAPFVVVALVAAAVAAGLRLLG